MRAKYLVFSLALLFSACGNGGNGEPLFNVGLLDHPQLLPSDTTNPGHPPRLPQPPLLPPDFENPGHPPLLPHPPRLPNDPIINPSGGISSTTPNVLAKMPNKYSGLPTYTTPNYADITKIAEKEHRDVLERLYHSSYLEFKPRLNNDTQGFSGNGVIIAVIDSGTDDLTASGVVKNSHYTYKNSVSTNAWNDLDNRLKNDNFIEHNFSANYVCEIDEPYNKVLHGKDVMLAASTVGSDLRFANVPLNFITPDGATTEDVGLKDLAATVDALSNQGIRFFNRSFGPIGDVNDYNYEFAPGVYFPAITKNNAIVVSAAGNYLTNGTHTANAIAPDNPMKKGWIIALGHLDTEKSNKLNSILKPEKRQKIENIYYIMKNGAKEYVHHWGDTCKSYGWDDCISASFESNGNHGTSFSTPIVTATAALIYEKYPWMSNDNIKETLFTTTYKVYTDVGKSPDDIKAHFGAGIINPAKAMNGVAELRKDFEANVDMVDKDKDRLYIFSNDISGTGGIKKYGNGTLALTGNNTFTGETWIKKGTLWLSKGQNYKADFINDDILRLSNIKTTGKITNNAILINGGDNTMGILDLGINSKIYSNLGDTINVVNNASLNGDYYLIGVDYTKNIALNTDIDLLTANTISGTFAKVESISPFLGISAPSYSANKVTVQADRIDASNIKGLDDYAVKNYEQLFNQIDDRLAYELSKQNKDTSDIAQFYTGKNLNGVSKINNFANMVLNTPRASLAALTNKIFATDLYTNSLMNIARVKSIHSVDIKDDFNITQTYNYNKIDGMKEGSTDTLVNTSFAFDDDNLSFAFNFNKAKVEKEDFNNNSTTIGLMLESSNKLSDFRLENRLSYFNIKNNYKRFDINAVARNDIFLFSSKLGYEINNFTPFIRANALFYKQRAYNEEENDSALGFQKFIEDFYYANLGIEYKNNYDGLKVNAGLDVEYNFSKDYNFLAKNILIGQNVEVSNGFYKKTLGNVNLGLNYTFDNNVNVGFDYKGSFAKDYITNKFMLGFGYIF